MSDTRSYGDQAYTPRSPAQTRETPAPKAVNPLGSAFFLWRWIKHFYFFIFLLIAPYMYYDFFGDIKFTVFMFILYFLVIYNDWFTARMADRKFILWMIPGVRGLVATTVEGFAKLRAYYAGRPPIGWLRSIFSIFLLPFSADVRKEWKLFNALVAFGMVFLILEIAGWVQEYFTIYR